MNKNAERLLPLYSELAEKIRTKDFLVDKSGVKLVEILSPRVLLIPSDLFIDFKTRKSPRKYIETEHDWYMSHSLKNDKVSHIKIWEMVADDHFEINSNYGNLVYSRNNFSQFWNVVENLKNHKESRQGIIIYTRPSIHYEWNSHGVSDFICSNFQQFFIRNDKLHTVTSMRSNDCWTGTFSDIPWFHHVINHMYSTLLETYTDLTLGDHIFIPNSFHCYERNFDKLLEMVDSE